MGIFSRKKDKIEQITDEYFKLMNAYSPSFSSFEGGLYEMDLTRAAIHTFANHCSKLKPIVRGSGNENLERTLQRRPNRLMDAKKYLYRLATVLATDNTAFIAPIYDSKGVLNGFYPLSTNKCKIVTAEDGRKFVKYSFDLGIQSACELEKMGIMTQFQYKDELFGENNAPMRATMDLMNIENQGIINSVKNSANIRFLAKLANTLKPKDIDDERRMFRDSNLSAENNGGVLLIDQKYAEVKQIDSKVYSVNPTEREIIKDSVFNYFGCNDKILQNKYTSAEWNAYFEGKIEPFAIEASLVHSNMAFSDREIAFGNEIMFDANRLQYMSGSEKLEIVTQLFDRGFITHNEGLEILNMSPIEGGDTRYIRKEYTETEHLNDEMQNVTISNDDEYNDDGGQENANEE